WGEGVGADMDYARQPVILKSGNYIMLAVHEDIDEVRAEFERLTKAEYSLPASGPAGHPRGFCGSTDVFCGKNPAVWAVLNRKHPTKASLVQREVGPKDPEGLWGVFCCVRCLWMVRDHC
ncbi:MAG: hypothetical protein PUB63_02650, partial [Clostridia bacterium]|nr:hypothetical protein [Clostridia bacterium]